MIKKTAGLAAVLMMLALAVGVSAQEDAAPADGSSATSMAAGDDEAAATDDVGGDMDGDEAATGGEEGGEADGQQGQEGERRGLLDGGMFLPLILMFVVFYFLMFRGPKKKQQQHQKMLSAMKKGDRIRTIGGIIGSVVDVRDDEVVLKVDESTNTKMRLARSAVSKIMTEDEQDQGK